MNETDYLPALRYRFLTPLFDAVVRVTMREKTFKSALLDQARLQAGHRVLDLGCGTGTLALMAKRHEPSARVEAVDADPDILARGRRKAAAEGVAVEFSEGLAGELPYDDGSFDRVLSTLFIHHLEPADKLSALREVSRVLRPGGEFHVADYTSPADAVQAALSWQVRLFDGFERTRALFDGELPRLLADAGFNDPRELQRFRTYFGTLGLVSARG